MAVEMSEILMGRNLQLKTNVNNNVFVSANGTVCACQLQVIYQTQVRTLRVTAFALVFCICATFCVSQLKADPPTFDAFLSGQVVDDSQIPVTNLTVFATDVFGSTNSFSALTDTNGNFSIGVLNGTYSVQLDNDPATGVFSRGLLAPAALLRQVSTGVNVTNMVIVAPRIIATITVTIVKTGQTNFVGYRLINTSSGSLLGLAPSASSGNANISGHQVVEPAGLLGDTNVAIPVPIPNLDVGAVTLGLPRYISATQRTDTNGTTVLYVCAGTWELRPDWAALDAMNLYGGNTPGVRVLSNDVTTIVGYDYYFLPQIQTNLVAGTNGVAYAGSLTSLGYWPFSWAIVEGTLPPGLALDTTGVISGYPTREGSYSFVAQVTDELEHSATTNITINIAPPPPPQLSLPQCSDLSLFQFHLAGIRNQNYAIQFTTDLTNWTTLAVTNTTSPDVIFVDTNAGDSMRIYRAVQEP